MFERVSKFFKKPPEEAVGKAGMANESGGSPAAFDQKTFSESLMGNFKSHLAEVVKPLQDEIASLKGKEKPATETPEKPLTRSEMLKLMQEQNQQSVAQSELQGKKKDFIGTKLKDLPAIYHGQLGNDPAKWADEEQAIRTQFKADFKTAGGKVADVGGETGAGGAVTPITPIDMSKMTASQKMELGLKQSKAARAPSSVGTRTTEVTPAAATERAV